MLFHCRKDVKETPNAKNRGQGDIRHVSSKRRDYSLIGRAALSNVVNEPRALSLQWRVGSIRVLARGSLVGSAHACARAASSSHTSGQS